MFDLCRRFAVMFAEAADRLAGRGGQRRPELAGAAPAATTTKSDAPIDDFVRTIRSVAEWREGAAPHSRRHSLFSDFESGWSV